MATLTLNEVGGPAIALVGGRVIRLLEFTGDTDYVTGGWPFTAAMCGLTTIDMVLAPPAAGYTFQHDPVAHTLMALIGDNNNAADGPLIDAPSGDNGLDGVVTRIAVIGSK